MVSKYGCLNGFVLKIIMMILMFLDHARGIYGLISENFYMPIIIITRCVAPVFAYFCVEGVRRSRNPWKYGLRLLTLGIIVFIGNMAINAILPSIARNIAYENIHFIQSWNNVAITLAMGVFMLLCFQKAANKNSKNKAWYIFAGVVTLIIGFCTEWGMILMPFMLVVYFVKQFKYRMVAYGAIELYSILFNSEYFWIVGLPVIGLYNGERGPKNNFSKYIFYIFYPAHLWLIAILNFFLLN